VIRKQLNNVPESSIFVFGNEGLGVSMTAPTFTVKVEQDRINLARYRWKIYNGSREHDVSVYSFATKREALKDAEKFVAKLNSSWGAI
jgi:hypothetical protein